MWRIAAFLAVALSGCTAPAQKVASASASSERELAVLDARTLRIDGEIVRLAGVDAPALPPFARCSAEGALSVAATRGLREMLEAANTVVMEPTATAPGGIKVARVRLDGNDLGQALVFDGLAAEQRATPWDWCGPAAAADGGPNLAMQGPLENRDFAAWADDALVDQVEQAEAQALGR